MVSFLSLSVPICTVGLTMAPEAPHIWLPTDLASFPLCSHFSPPHSGILSQRPSQDCSGPDMGREPPGAWHAGQGRRDKGNMAVPEVCRVPAATPNHPSGWSHCPCLPGEDPKGLGGGSGRQQGSRAQGQNHKSLTPDGHGGVPGGQRHGWGPEERAGPGRMEEVAAVGLGCGAKISSCRPVGRRAFLQQGVLRPSVWMPGHGKAGAKSLGRYRTAGSASLRPKHPTCWGAGSGLCPGQTLTHSGVSSSTAQKEEEHLGKTRAPKMA